MLVIFPLNIVVIYLLLVWFHPALFFVGLFLLLPIAIPFYVVREIFTRKQLDAEHELLKKKSEEARQALERAQAEQALRAEEARQVQALARANVKAGLPETTGIFWDDVERRWCVAGGTDRALAVSR